MAKNRGKAELANLFINGPVFMMMKLKYLQKKEEKLR